jgi:putative sterol carrier protein
MFRTAKEEDIAELVELTLAFCRKTPISKVADVSIEKLTDIYLTYIVDGKGIVWVSINHGKIDGFIAGHVGELAFSKDKCGQVQCWWAEKNKRFKERAENLLCLFQTEAFHTGATSIVITSLFSKAIEKIYEEENYKPYEKIYIKDLRQ